ncbi:MAG: DUF3109 family protein [Bacteroidota bacterium]
MIIVGNAVLSDDVKEQFFVCNLKKCQGACCVEGDAGAPLEKEELPILDEIYEDVKPFLTKVGIREIEKQGKYTTDRDNDYVTPIINGRECVYATRDKKGMLKCGIEQAYQAGKTSFRKPISCHLYPLRIDTYDNYDAVNYHRWHICNPACDLGRELGVPLYRFLKEPLIRKYGEDWYNELVDKIERG